jgi:hypothetical protein
VGISGVSSEAPIVGNYCPLFLRAHNASVRAVNRDHSQQLPVLAITPDRVRRASNLTMTIFTISNTKSMKNVGWSLGDTEIVRTALDLCRQNLEDPLVDIVGPLYRRLESEGR